MCFPSVQAAVAPAPAPPAPAPVAAAVSPETGYNSETQGQTGYTSGGTPNMMRGAGIKAPTPGGVAGAGPAGIGGM